MKIKFYIKPKLIQIRIHVECRKLYICNLLFTVNITFIEINIKVFLRYLVYLSQIQESVILQWSYFRKILRVSIWTESHCSVLFLRYDLTIWPREILKMRQSSYLSLHIPGTAQTYHHASFQSHFLNLVFWFTYFFSFLRKL